MENTEQATAVVRTVPVEFSGKGWEFFKIWIVNLSLSIITLGIYSAWAKVRTHRYMTSHTSIDGHRFRYLANPLQILKGRLIAAALFAVYVAASTFLPLLELVLAIALFFAFPWLLVQSIKFNLRMTSYRNVRFGFDASYGDIILCFMFYPILGLLSFGFAFPWVFKEMDQVILKGIKFGDRPLNITLKAGEYYAASITAICIASIVGTLCLALIFLPLIFMAGGLDTFSADQLDLHPMIIGVFTSVVVIFYMFSFAVAQAAYTTIVRNHIFKSGQFTGVASFQSNVKIWSFSVLMATNGLIALFTLGLGYPIVIIRTQRYLANATMVNVMEDIDRVVDEQADSSVIGEEAAEMFDVGFGIG